MKGSSPIYQASGGSPSLGLSRLGVATGILRIAARRDAASDNDGRVADPACGRAVGRCSPYRARFRCSAVLLVSWVGA